MASASQVPQTRSLGEGELSADHAWRALRRYGGWPLLRDALVRFRSGDGFSHARALGLQLCLAAVPLLIALVWATGESGTGRSTFGDTWRIGLLHDIDLSSGAEDEAPPGLVRSWQWRWQRLRGRSFERVLVAGALLWSAIERRATGGSIFREEGDL